MTFPKENKSSRRRFLATLLGSAGLAVGLPIVWNASSGQKKHLPKLYQGQRKMMGTWVSISLFAHDEKLAMSAMAQAFQSMKEIDTLMSIHQSSSQLSQINTRAGQDTLAVNAKVIQVLQRAKVFSEKSDGAYDITILPLMNLFGLYGQTPKHIPSDKSIAKALDAVGSSSIYIDSIQNRVGLLKKGSAIDVGSIGKGYAVDCAAQSLKHMGIQSALIDAGGNLFAMGAPYEDPDPRAGWRVAIKNPVTSSKDFFKTIMLKDQAVATSGVDQNHVTIGSKEIGHIFDGRTGNPCSDYISCSALAPNAMDADALSTTGYILGPSKAETLFANPDMRFFFHT